MNNIKSKRLLKIGNFIYSEKIQILLIDTDKLLFLQNQLQAKLVNNFIKK